MQCVAKTTLEQTIFSVHPEESIAVVAFQSIGCGYYTRSIKSLQYNGKQSLFSTLHLSSIFSGKNRHSWKKKSLCWVKVNFIEVMATWKGHQKHISKQNTYLPRLASLKLLQQIYFYLFIHLVSQLVSGDCYLQDFRWDIFTVPTIVELAGIL